MRTTHCLLPIAALWLLTSCASWKPVTTASEPPRIDCSARAPIEPLPHTPRLANLPAEPQTDTWWRAYVGRLSAVWAGYARQWQGFGEAEVIKRAEVANCLDAERAAGRIR